MTEPTTEAGRRLLDGFAPAPLPDAQELHRRSGQGRRDKLTVGILAIEAEARADALREAAERVRARMKETQDWIDAHPTRQEALNVVNRAAIAAFHEALAILDPEPKP